MKYPHVQQHDERDCGVACLSMVLKYYGMKVPISKLREKIKADNIGANIYGIVQAAENFHLEANALEGTFSELTDEIKKDQLCFPFIARIITPTGFEHFIVVYNIKGDTLTIADPGKTSVTKMPVHDFQEQWQGQIITFTPKKSFTKMDLEKGSLTKFFKYITKQKKMLVYVFIMSIIVAVINMSGSILFEYILSDTIVATENIEQTVYELDSSGEDHDHEHDHDHSYEEIDTPLSKSKLSIALDKMEEKMNVVFANINTVCLTFIGMYLFGMLIAFLRGYLLIQTSRRVDIPLTLNYYDHLINLPAEFFGSRKTGELMSRFYDTEKIRSAISSTTLTIMLDTLMAIAGGVILFFINSTLFLITVAILIVYAVIIMLFRNPIRNVNHEYMEQEAQVTSFLKESIEGIETIKSFNFEKNTIDKTTSKYTTLANKAVKSSLLSILLDILSGKVEAIGTVVLLWVGTAFCLKDIISVADLFMFYYLIEYFLDPVKNLINLQPELQTAMVAAERLNDILDVEIENNDKEKVDKLKGNIVCKDIDFRYGYRNLVLKDVSMTFKSGTKTAIVGESGCGKTTLAKLIMQFYTPEKGSITVNGTNLADASQESVRQRISYISQDIFLFSDTVYNNLRIGNSQITDEEITEMCKKCGADEFINNLPMGYKTVLEENGNNLSGGQKQRLAIARALLKKPDILIMDEATSNLDTVTEQSIKNLIDSLSEEITCIIIAHRLTTIKSCDYIYVMDKGTVVESGTHQELLEKNGMYKQLTDNI